MKFERRISSSDLGSPSSASSCCSTEDQEGIFEDDDDFVEALESLDESQAKELVEALNALDKGR